MKKFIVAILSVVLVAMGAMFIFAQTAEKPEGKRGFHKRGHFGKRGGQAMLFRGFELTDEQKAQIKQIRQTSKTTVKPIREQMKANRQKLNELSANGNFEQAQVQAIAAQQGSLSAQLIVEKEKVKSQMFSVLTPEQKAKAAELKAEFKQKRQERRQNRMNKHQGSGEAETDGATL